MKMHEDNNNNKKRNKKSLKYPKEALDVGGEVVYDRPLKWLAEGLHQVAGGAPSGVHICSKTHRLHEAALNSTHPNVCLERPKQSTAETPKTSNTIQPTQWVELSELFSVARQLILTQMWLCATSSASASLVTIPSQNRPQIVNFLPILLLLLISYLLLQSFHSVHPFQAASFFCRHMNTLYPPCQNKNLWPVLFLLLCSKALEFTSFWYSSH